ncbi:malonyl-CoA synthase [Undibacterium sp. LX40W]|uniref:Malonyl-CoA synthase n=1 Tax=Undibacterium nitidum TaxID=2762298 RepID=A0A923HJ83_9BURK|nr:MULTISPECIES: malonyl-CoA synthase [Undibacterium]MBC3880399.1 malonyl-CoA synthase [Undibacterium nitidum]MBC3890864.1 malonyl-CoA synthase [Undibacterium sp. LX40W]
MNANLYALFAQGFPSDQSRCCIETLDQAYYSYRDIERASAKIANLLSSLNLSPGARIAVQVEKSPEALILYLATLRAGYVFLPLNTAYQRQEIQYFIEDAEPEVVVCSPKHFGWVSQLAFQADTKFVFTLDATSAGANRGSLLDRATPMSDEFETVHRDSHDLAAILYTSGTTGRSKGAMLSHGNLYSNAKVLHRAWAWQENDVLIHALPLFHVHGLFVASHAVLMSGARMIFLAKFDAERVIQELPRATVMMGVPTYYVRLLQEAHLNRQICQSMRLFISGSAPLLSETFHAFAERTGHTILERYGMSETTMLVSNPYLGRRKAGTVGMALEGISVRVVDEHGKACRQGEIGGIEVHGPNVFQGYWRMPEKTAEEFTLDGYFRTGDVGRFDEEGYLSIVGRSKDLIISGGYNVYPKEIESIIDDMPEVDECAVIGIPHADFGEAVCAVVVLKRFETLDGASIIQRLKSQIANFKVPKQIHIVTELPRNAMGKVQKNLLRQQYSTSI